MSILSHSTQQHISIKSTQRVTYFRGIAPQLHPLMSCLLILSNLFNRLALHRLGSVLRSLLAGYPCQAKITWRQKVSPALLISIPEVLQCTNWQESCRGQHPAIQIPCIYISAWISFNHSTLHGASRVPACVAGRVVTQSLIILRCKFQEIILYIQQIFDSFVIPWALMINHEYLGCGVLTANV